MPEIRYGVVRSDFELLDYNTIAGADFKHSGQLARAFFILRDYEDFRPL